MTEYTIDDIRGPTVAREMAQLKEFVLAQFNGAIADAEAAAAAAATAAANAVLANTVKKTGEASQSIAGDIAVTGSLDAASIGSGSTPVVCGNLTAFGSVSLDDTTLQGNLASADSSALINLAGAGSVLVPTPTSNSEAANKKYVDDALDNYSAMLRTAGDQSMTGKKTNVFNAATSGASNAPAGYIEQVSNIVVNSTNANRYFMLAEAIDSNGVLIAGLNVRYNANGNVHFGLVTTDSNGDLTQKDIGVFNRSAGTWS